MIKYATALRLGTAEAEQVLRRFTKGGNPKHPVYLAPEELGRVIPVRLRLSGRTAPTPGDPRGPAGGGELEQRRRQDLLRAGGRADRCRPRARRGVHAHPHLLQSSLVYINTLLLRAVLRDPAWARKLTPQDRRALSPLFWAHINPYGRFHLDMDSRLDLTEVA